jgi:protein gp37
MSMNKTAIESFDLSWNPATGCYHPCRDDFCYADRIAHRFPKNFININPSYDCMMDTNLLTRDDQADPFSPQFHLERLIEPAGLKKRHTIFVCSMADLFGEWVPQEWIEAILYVAARTRGQDFCFLTKNPRRMAKAVDEWRDLRSLKECHSTLWFGTSVTCRADMHRIPELSKVWYDNLFVSFEPLLGDPGRLPQTEGLRGILIGAQTPVRQYPPGMDHWIDNLVVDAGAAGCKVFFKNSLADLHGAMDSPWMRELPWKLNKVV